MEKQFNTMFNIGKAKYVINSHDGTATHKDGSPFFGVDIFKNKRLFNKKRKELLTNNYTETN